jgi:peptide deformylase
MNEIQAQSESQSKLTPLFEIVTEKSSPEAPKLDEQTPAWIKSNKALLIEFLCYAKSLKGVLGLAANQLLYNGSLLNKRFFAFRPKKNTDCNFELAIDPVIEEKFGEQVEELEGCLSWPGKTILAQRHLKIRVSYYNLDGEKIERTLDRFESQVWQHEMNHLDGIEENVLPESTPYQREQPKTGRNDPCPCGSGKKFKKCCGA